MTEKELILAKNGDNIAKLVVKIFDETITDESTINFTLTVNYEGCDDILIVNFAKIRENIDSLLN